MPDYFTEQLKLLKQSLERLNTDRKTLLQRSEEALDLLNQVDAEFKRIVKQAPFKNETEEIRYFKYQRPQLLADIIYYLKIYHLETTRPPGSPKSMRKHYKKELNKIDAFFSDNKDFVQYIRSGATVADSLLFLRNNINHKTVRDSSYSSLDPEQTTNYDHKAAKLQAYERLQGYLLNRLRQLKGPGMTLEEDSAISNERPPNDRLIKSHQVLRLLAISESTLQKMRKNGTIPYRKMGGILYYYESEILKVLEDVRRKEQFGD